MHVNIVEYAHCLRGFISIALLPRPIKPVKAISPCVDNSTHCVHCTLWNQIVYNVTRENNVTKKKRKTLSM